MPEPSPEALGPTSPSLEYAVAPAMPLDIPKPSFVQACVLRFALLLNNVFGGLHPDIALLIIWYLQGLIWLDIFAPSRRSSQELHNSHCEMAFNPDDTFGIKEDRVSINPVQTHTSTGTHEAAAGEKNGGSQSPCHSPSIDIERDMEKVTVVIRRAPQSPQKITATLLPQNVLPSPVTPAHLLPALPKEHSTETRPSPSVDEAAAAEAPSIVPHATRPSESTASISSLSSAMSSGSSLIRHPGLAKVLDQAAVPTNALVVPNNAGAAAQPEVHSDETPKSIQNPPKLAEAVIAVPHPVDMNYLPLKDCQGPAVVGAPTAVPSKDLLQPPRFEDPARFSARKDAVIPAPKQEVQVPPPAHGLMKPNIPVIDLDVFHHDSVHGDVWAFCRQSQIGRSVVDVIAYGNPNGKLIALVDQAGHPVQYVDRDGNAAQYDLAQGHIFAYLNTGNKVLAYGNKSGSRVVYVNGSGKIWYRKPAKLFKPKPNFTRIVEGITQVRVNRNERVEPRYFIGSGACGIVMAASHSRYGDVGLKLLNKREHAKSVQMFQALRLEYQALRKISENTVNTNTKFLVPLLHSWDDGKFVHLITPLYICSLTDHLMSIDRLSKNDVKFFASQLATALCALNQLQIVHHDIKPLNIFISQGGDLALGDYGMCAIRSSGIISEPHGGTFAYRSPQKTLIKRPEDPPYSNFDHAGDVWSMGVVFLEMMLQPDQANDIIASLTRINIKPTHQKELDEYVASLLRDLLSDSIIDTDQYDILSRMLEVDVKKRINAWELASGTKYLGNVHQELPKLKLSVLPRAAKRFPLSYMERAEGLVPLLASPEVTDFKDGETRRRQLRFSRFSFEYFRD